MSGAKCRPLNAALIHLTPLLLDFRRQLASKAAVLQQMGYSALAPFTLDDVIGGGAALRADG